MAYAFSSSSSQKLTVPDDAAFDFSTEFTISFWSKNVASTFLSYQAFVCKSGSFGHPYSVYQVNDSSQNRLRLVVGTSAGYAVLDSPIGSGWGSEWTQVVVCYNGGGSTTADKVQMYKNGNSLSVFLRSGTIPAALSNTSDPLDIAHHYVRNYLNGSLAELAMWDKQLTSDEAVSLSRGVNATAVRPQSLVFYAPLVRDLIDTKSGLAITNVNGATVADHPRIYG